MASRALEGLLEDDKIKKYLHDNPDVAQGILNQHQSSTETKHSIVSSKVIAAIFAIICLVVLVKYFLEVAQLRSKIEAKTQTTQQK